MALHQISIHDFLGAAVGSPAFTIKRGLAGPFLPMGACVVGLSDGAQAFFVFNQMLEMSRFDNEISDYTDDVYETVILAGRSEIYDAIVPGEDISFRLDWPGGPMIWSPLTFEEVRHQGDVLKVGVVEAVTSVARFAARPIEFLLDLRLTSSAGEWRIERAPNYPDFLRLSPVPLEGFWGSGWRQQTASPSSTSI